MKYTILQTCQNGEFPLVHKSGSDVVFATNFTGKERFMVNASKSAYLWVDKLKCFTFPTFICIHTGVEFSTVAAERHRFQRMYECISRVKTFIRENFPNAYVDVFDEYGLLDDQNIQNWFDLIDLDMSSKTKQELASQSQSILIPELMNIILNCF